MSSPVPDTESPISPKELSNSPKGDAVAEHTFHQTPDDETLNASSSSFASRSLPFAVLFIIPNEAAERFCYYGITPLLKSFFTSALGMDKVQANEFTHIFKMLAYFFPLFGAALSDSFLNKFRTIVSLSIVYLIGTLVLTVTSIPGFLSSRVGTSSSVPEAGPLIGLLLMAIGTGGIKPCVSSHGGDQFTEAQQNGLERFYNYFYLSINIGSLAAGFITPYVADLTCFGNEKDCYAPAFGICAGMMAFATIIFTVGYKYYKIAPPAGTFLPGQLLFVLFTYLKAWVQNAFSSVKATAQAIQVHGDDLVTELFDLGKVVLMILPAPFFWMAFEQNNSSFQDMTDVMDRSYWINSVTMNAVTNPILIVILAVVFSEFIYPTVERIFPKKFRQLERMTLGMMLSAVAFCICGVYQMHIDSICSTRVNADGKDEVVCSQPFHMAWFIIPYFVLTCGEILFSISGLNFTYSEVGLRTKSSCAALWLLTSAFGNLMATALFSATKSWYEGEHREYFYFLVAGLCFAAGLLQGFLRMFYVYREDRVESPGSPKSHSN